MKSTQSTCLLPDASQPARLIVCERTGWWAVWLRQELSVPVRIDSTRTLDDAWCQLAVAPTSFLVVELHRGVERLVRRLATLGREYPLARAAVVMPRSLADCELLLREAGAAHVCTSPRRVTLLADLVRRHLETAPLVRGSLTDEIWAALPWGRQY
jgi:hypothetical protein